MKSTLFFLLFILFYTNGLTQFTVNFSTSSVASCTGETINFTDLSSSPNGVVSWVWDFGDGNSSTIQNPAHTYASAGTYTVILTANNGVTSVDEVKVNYIIVHPIPQPSFNLSNPSCALPTSVSVSNVVPASGVTYQWDFGNGQSSTLQNPANPSYTTEGTYNVRLTVRNSTTGCTNNYSRTLNVFNYNTAFSPNSTTVCVGSTVEFTDESSPGTDSYLWNFGNGETASTANPSTIYNAIGTYTVRLSSRNSINGCNDEAIQTIRVVNAQAPSLSPSITMGCNPLTVSFTNTTGFNGAFTWNFGNGSSYEGENPPPQIYTIADYNQEPDYPLSGSFNVILHVVDENGCASMRSYNDLIKIYNLRPSFNASIVEGCADLQTTFTDHSYSPIPDFPINSWQWTFGNGQTYNGQNPPAQTYSHGIYGVSLTISTAMGCETTVDSFNLIQVGVPPNVLFTVEPDELCARQTATFVNLTTVNVPHGSEEIDYYWRIGTQGPFMEFEPNNIPIIDTGLLDVQLIVSFRGCRDTLTLEDEIFVHPPLVRFNAPGTICNPEIPVLVNIDDSSILGRQGDQVQVFWDLGDGTTHTFDSATSWQNNNQRLTHVYNDYGAYEIKQKIINFDTGCTDSISSMLIINYFNVDLNFVSDSVCHGDLSQFGWSFQSIPVAQANEYDYFVDNVFLGNSSEPTITNPMAYLFETIGLHEIRVDATNSFGCMVTPTDRVFIVPLPEAAIASIDVAGCVPSPVVMTDGSISRIGLPIVDYIWSFNGVTPTVGNGQPTFTTTINTIGTHSTTLQVRDAFGCIGTTTVQTDILEPIADFALPLVVCNNNLISIPNLSANYSTSEWFLNNQLVSTNGEGEFMINHPNNPNVLSYTDSITLIVRDVHGCSSTLTLPVTTSSPNAAYTYNFTGSNVDEFGNFACPSVFTSFTNGSQSIGEIVNYSWNFGDGKFSSLQNPSNTYVFAGTYMSSLTITDEFGCRDSIIFNDYLTINGPSGTFSVSPAGTLCDPNYLFSAVTLNSVVDVEWFTGDGGNFNSLIGDEYIFASSGTYFPYVTLTDANNCSITYFLDTLNIQFGNLNAAFTASPLTLNWGEPLVVNNHSTGGNGGIVNNNWTIGSENFNQQSEQFNYLFNERGQLSILLIVTDSIGCVDSTWISAFVTDRLDFPNVFTPNKDGVNDYLRIRENAYAAYEVFILNRWGNEMSRTQVVNDDYLWDGKTQNGVYATEGVYYYYVKGNLRDGTPKEDHGFFHLVID